MANGVKFILFLRSLAHNMERIVTERDGDGEMLVGVIICPIKGGRKLQCVQGAKRKDRNEALRLLRRFPFLRVEKLLLTKQTGAQELQV